MKKIAENIVAATLGWQLRRLRKRHDFKVIVIAGSVGKTTTKFAVAEVLKQSYRVRYQEGNYNHIVSVPLIFFGREIPSLFNPLAWLSVFIKNEAAIRSDYPYDIIVAELGTDGPGQIKKFGSYLTADIGVLTAIVPEHMEFFKDLEAVAREELAIEDFSTSLLINRDLCAPEYTGDIKVSRLTYAIKQDADFRIKNLNFSAEGCDFEIHREQNLFLKTSHEAIAEPQLYSICVAVAVGAQMGMSAEAIEKGIREIKPVNGRMRGLPGVLDSLIIDDTYNANPEAMRAALDTLYRVPAPQKIAVLGNMNELGGYSQKLHQQIGEYCDPGELDLVVTIGPDANKYLAPAAASKGCAVKTFTDPYSAGEYIKTIIKPKSAVLVKGSQNKVFAEETVKFLLDDPGDSAKLVRQSDKWLKIKLKQFGGN